MRLADFIRREIGPILADWERFAETIMSARHMDTTALREHAREMLLVIASDLDGDQSESERVEKSKGLAPEEAAGSWAEVHGGDRQTSGFSVMEIVSEFRALRASVVSHWTSAYPTVTGPQLEDLTRFHEAIDRAVAESLEQYTIVKEIDTRLFGAILVASPHAIFVLDLDGKSVYANRATAELVGMRPDAVIGKSTYEFGFSFASEFHINLEKVLANQSTYRGQMAHTFASGKGKRFEYVIAPVLDELQKTEAVVCIFRDVTERALAEEKVWYNAHHDLLTGLPNRRLFLDRLDQEIKHAKRDSLPLAVLFMDLDGFKEVNDSVGHEVGDRLLQGVAERLSGCVREDDTVARMGGDEFTVILSGTKRRKDVERVVRTFFAALAAPFDIGGQAVQVSASIGVSFYPGDASSPVALLQASDQAMYKAKEAPASRLFFYDVADQPPRHRRHSA